MRAAIITILSIASGLVVTCCSSAALADSTTTLHLGVWSRLTVADAGEIEIGIARLRPRASLRVDQLRFGGKLELAAGRPELLDGYVEAPLGTRTLVRAGRFKTPFSRLYSTSTAQLELPGRGLVVDYFAPGRALGVMVEWSDEERSEVGFGAFLMDSGPALIGRGGIAIYGEVPSYQSASLATAQPSGLSVGLDASYEHDWTLDDAITAGLDVQLVEGAFAVLAEGYVRDTVRGEGGATQAVGAMLQGSLFVVPRRLQFVVRGGYLSVALEAPRGSCELGLTLYVASTLAGDPQDVVLMASALFEDETSSHLTLQLLTSL